MKGAVIDISLVDEGHYLFGGLNLSLFVLVMTIHCMWIVFLLPMQFYQQSFDHKDESETKAQGFQFYYLLSFRSYDEQFLLEVKIFLKIFPLLQYAHKQIQICRICDDFYRVF